MRKRFFVSLKRGDIMIPDYQSIMLPLLKITGNKKEHTLQEVNIRNIGAQASQLHIFTYSISS